MVPHNLICSEGCVSLLHTVYCRTNLEHHISDHILWEELVPVVVSLLHQLVQVLLHILKHKVEGVIFSDHLK